MYTKTVNGLTSISGLTPNDIQVMGKQYRDKGYYTLCTRKGFGLFTLVVWK